MGEPVDPNYHPPLPFTPPEQRTNAQSQPGYPGGYPPPVYGGGYPPPQYRRRRGRRRRPRTGAAT